MARFFILASFFSFFISIRAMAQLTSSSPMAYSTDSSSLVFNLASAPLGSNAGAFTGPDGRETAEFATTINNCKPSQLLPYQSWAGIKSYIANIVTEYVYNATWSQAETCSGIANQSGATNLRVSFGVKAAGGSPGVSKIDLNLIFSSQASSSGTLGENSYYCASCSIDPAVAQPNPFVPTFNPKDSDRALQVQLNFTNSYYVEFPQQTANNCMSSVGSMSGNILNLSYADLKSIGGN